MNKDKSIDKRIKELEKKEDKAISEDNRRMRKLSAMSTEELEEYYYLERWLRNQDY
jgi:hypothetical protein